MFMLFIYLLWYAPHVVPHLNKQRCGLQLESKGDKQAKVKTNKHQNLELDAFFVGKLVYVDQDRRYMPTIPPQV